MKNTATLNNWFLMKYPTEHVFNIHGHSTDFFCGYFALPTDNSSLRLFGNTHGDARADEATTEFNDGHRIITGKLTFFKPMQAETECTIYILYSVYQRYVEWLKERGYILKENSHSILWR